MIENLMTRTPLCVSPETPINEAVHRMGVARIGCVLIAVDDELLGIFSERDLLNMFATSATVSLHVPILEHMTKMSLQTIGLDAEPVDALCLMVKNNIRHLPVLHENRIVGILGLRDLVFPDEITPVPSTTCASATSVATFPGLATGSGHSGRDR